MNQPQAPVSLAPQFASQARQVVQHLLTAIRLLRGHGEHNAAYLSGLQNLVHSINSLLPQGGGQIEFIFYDDILMLNGSILRVNAQLAQHFRSLAGLWLERDVGGVGFLRAVQPELLSRWLKCFDRVSPGDQEQVHATLRALQGYGIQTLPPKILTRQDMEVVRLSSFGFGVQAYARAILGFRDFVEALRVGDDPFAGKLSVVRVVQDLVDLTTTSPALMRKVLDSRDEHREVFSEVAGSYAARHAASTCVWALLVGAMLKLDRYALLDLGTSTLLSKVGFALLPEEMTQKKGELTAQERRDLRLGTVRAVQALIARSRLSDVMMRRVVVAYEHQRPYASPNRPTSNNLHIYARIAAVTDAYDAMVTARSWRGALPPDVALQNLQRQAGTRFDPNLVAVLTVVVRAGA